MQWPEDTKGVIRSRKYIDLIVEPLNFIMYHSGKLYLLTLFVNLPSAT
jgi:hypothetical protein